jgi:hypothetical protein
MDWLWHRKVDGHAIKGKVLSEFVGQRLEEVFLVGPGDHGIVDLKQHLVACLGIPAHPHLVTMFPRSNLKFFCPKGKRKFGLAPNIGRNLLADNLAIVFYPMILIK